MTEPRDNQINAAKAATDSSNHEHVCELVENRIHELMDHRQALLSDNVVKEHVSQCDQCAQLVVDFGALNDSVSQIPLVTLQRLARIQGVERVDDVAPSRAGHPVLFVASIACLLLFMLTSGIWFSGEPDQMAVVDSMSRIEMVSVANAKGGVLESRQDFTNSPRGDNSSDALLELPELSGAFRRFAMASPHKSSPATEFIGANLEEFSGNVEPYEEYIAMTAELPGMRPVSTSVNATIQLIKTFSGRPQRYVHAAL